MCPDHTRCGCVSVGRHHMVDVTGAIINDEILHKVGHAMVDAMEVSQDYQFVILLTRSIMSSGLFLKTLIGSIFRDTFNDNCLRWMSLVR